MPQYENFEMYLNSVLPYKDSKFSHKLFNDLAMKLKDNKNDSFKDFILYITDNLYKINEVTAISDINEKNKKLKIKECILVNGINDECRKKAIAAIKMYINEEKRQLKREELKCLVLDIKC